METKLIQYDFLPRKYHLRWDGTRMAIIIQVHKDWIHGAPTVPMDGGWKKWMQEKFEGNEHFKEFSGNFHGEYFGFCKAIERIGEVDDYVEFAVDIPVLEFKTGKPCVRCEGTAKDSFDEERACFSCEGSGNGIEFDFRRGFALTASLSLFFNILELENPEIKTTLQQDVKVDGIVCEPGNNGSSLGGRFGIAFTSYCKVDPPELYDVMKKVHEDVITIWKHMFPIRRFDRHTIRLNWDGRLCYIQVQGNATGIHFSTNSSRDYGMEWSCHNVDTPHQCLALLAGIASLVGQVKIPQMYREKKVNV